MTIQAFPNDRPSQPESAMGPKMYRTHNPRTEADYKPEHLRGWDPEHFTACGIIIRTPSNKVLVSRRADTQSSPGCWQIPGGKANVNEEWVDAAVRETKEETGLVIAPGSLTLLGAWSVNAGEGAGRVKYKAVVFLYDSITEEIEAKDMEPDKCGPWQLMAIEELESQPMIKGLQLALAELVVPVPPPPPDPEVLAAAEKAAADAAEAARKEHDEFLDKLLKPSAEQIERQAKIARNVKLGLWLVGTLIAMLVIAIIFLAVVLVTDKTKEQKRAAPGPVEVEGGTGRNPGDYK